MDLAAVLRAQIQADPFNLVATGIFLLAILHTFAASRIAALAHRAPAGSVRSELLHFAGEVEVVFGLWAVVLLAAMTVEKGWAAATHYLNDTVNYTEALFVVVIMALASTRPIVLFAEAALRRVAAAGGGSPAAWWLTILIVGPLLGSFITEPGAMTICALLLGRQFYDLQPPMRLRYATLGLLFVNISIGGTLTHFAAPPVLMVARPWDWGLGFMLTHFGWRAVLAVIVSSVGYALVFRRDLQSLVGRLPMADLPPPDEDAATDQPVTTPMPPWVTAVHLAFMVWTVFTAHYPALFLGGFLFFLGFARATAMHQSRIELRTPLLVGFFLAGLVIHGGLQGWWIGPVLGGLTETPMFLTAAFLTAFNDNALITYLATLVPHLDPPLQLAVVGGAVAGGGLTVIANAPNPAGQALLARFFGGSISPLYLAAAALGPTIVATIALLFR
ncbi:MAG TPA: putative Na+/H+ antiporter [Vicinamibacterales bacterium]|nr:putative Na+/H+ antiporter [Vicinamibacterales bacterium]